MGGRDLLRNPLQQRPAHLRGGPVAEPPVRAEVPRIQQGLGQRKRHHQAVRLGPGPAPPQQQLTGGEVGIGFLDLVTGTHRSTLATRAREAIAKSWSRHEAIRPRPETCSSRALRHHRSFGIWIGPGRSGTARRGEVPGPQHPAATGSARRHDGAVRPWKRRLSDDERSVLLSELLLRHPELVAEAEEITSTLLVVEDDQEHRRRDHGQAAGATREQAGARRYGAGTGPGCPPAVH